MKTMNVEKAWSAFASGDWGLAKREFEAAAERDPSPEVIDGLGRTLWWLKDVTAAIEVRTTAYGAYRRANKLEQAAHVAVWLARELRTLFRNDAAADGWLARAETIAAELPASPIGGWISLARAEASSRASEAMELCRSALESVRRHGDANLEVVCLARLGVMEVVVGEVDGGVRNLDESMAAATGREASDPQSAAEANCCLLEAAELLGDSDRFAQWTSALGVLEESHGLGPLESLTPGTAYGNLSAFCAACCGGMYLVTGRLDEAEDELQRSIAELEKSGMQSRCVHPVTQLAELRVLQGRFEEARALLESYADLPEAVRPLAVLDLALGDPDAAARRLRDRLDEIEDATVGAFPLHTLLVDAYIALHDHDSARAGTTEKLDEICAPDLRGHAGAGADLAQLKQSIAGFREAFPDLHAGVRHAVAEDDLVSTWITYEGTHEGEFAGVTGLGGHVKFVAWDLIRVAEGRIAEMTQYCDVFTLMNQIGALPTAAPA
jgi:predicted ester cyclase